MAPMAPVMEDASAPLVADLLACLGALGRSLGQELAPATLLRDFSSHLQRVLPHDRLVLASLDDDGRTFSILGEHAGNGSLVHEHHDPSALSAPGRYRVADWSIQPVFAGETMLVEDAETDARLAHASPPEQRVRDAGYRSGVLVPLLSAGRVIGALSATSAVPRTYGPGHAETARRVADLIAPFVESAVLLQRERRRMERLRGVGELPRLLGASLDVKDVFDRLARAVRPLLDFEVMGVTLISSSGRDFELLAEAVLGFDVPNEPTPPRIPLDAFSFSPQIERGEPILVSDAAVELDPARAGDRMIIDGGGRSCLGVPLWLGERVGGALYFGHGRAHAFERRRDRRRRRQPTRNGRPAPATG